MKIIKYAIALLSALCLLISSALASTTNSSLSNQISTDQKLQKLEAQIQQLKKEVNAKKTSKKIVQTESKKDTPTDGVVTPGPVAIGETTNFPYYHAPFVFASPYLTGARSAYNASDLITSWPSIYEDLYILKAQKKHANALEAAGLPYPDRPIIAISGYVEGKAVYIDDYIPNIKSDIDLSGAELDILAQMTPWASAYMSIAYNSRSPDVGPRYSYSLVSLGRAFLTIGNLDISPIYGTIGQFYVPFGSYSSNMINSSVTKRLGRTLARAIELGFYSDTGIYGAIYTFKGDTDENRFGGINNAGANLIYKFELSQKFNATLGASYLYNLADSMGMQITGGYNNGNFVGFGGGYPYYTRSSSEHIVHAVAGGDVFAKLSYDKFNLSAEYVSALKKFAITDLMFDGNGAKPRALSVEAAYYFDITSKPASLSVTYGQTEDALALNIPKESYVATFGISLWKSTVEKIEYRHELNYGFDDYAAGGNQPGYITVGNNRVRNIGMFQIDVYF
jgi:outer membrane murein-binding lipoprotein Lpp